MSLCGKKQNKTGTYLNFIILSLVYSVACLFFPAREANDADFVSACHFVKAHMGNMDNPSEDMVGRLFLYILWLDCIYKLK